MPWSQADIGEIFDHVRTEAIECPIETIDESFFEEKFDRPQTAEQLIDVLDAVISEVRRVTIEELAITQKRFDRFLKYKNDQGEHDVSIAIDVERSLPQKSIKMKEIVDPKEFIESMNRVKRQIREEA